MTVRQTLGLVLCVMSLGAAAENGVTLTPLGTDAEKSCQDLYFEVNALLAVRHEASQGFWSDRKNQLAGAAGTAFKPAWFYLGYAALRHFQDQEGAIDATKRIADLRNALADKLCFVQ